MHLTQHDGSPFPEGTIFISDIEIQEAAYKTVVSLDRKCESCNKMNRFYIFVTD